MHKITAHNWENDILETIELFFESFEEAFAYAMHHHKHHHVKIYDDNFHLVYSHHGVCPLPEAYA